MLYTTFLAVLGLFYFRRLSKRIRTCEEKLQKLAKQSPLPPPIVVENHPPAPNIASTPPYERVSKPAPQEQVARTKTKIKFEIPAAIKENWMGVVGSIACVIGAVFFGSTSDLFSRPEVRVIVMLLFSLSLLAFTTKLKQWQLGPTACSWFNATAGAIILFATLGAGSIQGLQCLQSTEVSFAVLFLGIAVNIYLAAKTPSQAIASLHALLSMLALSVAPQTIILLPVGALITVMGIVIANRSRWDMFLLLLVLSFACQHIIWIKGLQPLQDWVHYLAIASSVLVALVAAASHHCERYRSQKIEVIPLLAHCTNWTLLGWNLYLHAGLGLQPFFLLALASISIFYLANHAKKKEIIWLYHADTIMAQIIALAAFASLRASSINALDIALLAFLEIILFNLICNLQKEKLLCRIGYFFQTCAYGVIMSLALRSLSSLTPDEALSLSVRLLLVTVISWAFYIFGKSRSFESDSFFSIFQGKCVDSSSIMVIAGTIFFCLSYACNADSYFVQAYAILGLVALSYWRNKNEDRSWNFAFLGSILCIHVLVWNSLLFQNETALPSTETFRIDFAGLLILDIVLVFGNMLQLKTWSWDIHDIILYLVALHTGLGTHLFCKESSVLIPGVAFLGYSLLVLELARYTKENLEYENAVKNRIEKGLLHVGYAFILGFISRFVTIHLQEGGLWNGLSLRMIVETLALLCIGYWIAYAPRSGNRFTEYCRNGLVELFLGFVSLCVLAEISDFYRPFIWAVIALALLLSTNYFQWPRRLYLYSWIYLLSSVINVAFLTSSINQPALSETEKHNLPVFAAIIAQLVYAYIVPRIGVNDTQNEQPLPLLMQRARKLMFKESNLSVLLPVFLGVALMLAYNYEKAILTLLWVGLSCLYLACGLLARSKASIQIAMCAMIVCIARLLFYDLVQKDIAIRAVVFFGAGTLMLLISVFYKKYKYRIELHEQI